MVQVATIVGSTQVKNSLNKVDRAMPGAMKRALKAGGAMLIDGMRSRAPQLSDEYKGTIARSVHLRDVKNEMSVLVGTNHGLAATFEYGGEITAKKARVLISKEHEAVFGPRVIAPARPFARPTVDQDSGKAWTAVRGSISKSFGDIARTLPA